MKSLRESFVAAILTVFLLSSVLAQSDSDYDLTTMMLHSELQETDSISLTPPTSTIGTVLWDVTHGSYSGYYPYGNFAALVSVINDVGLSVDMTSSGLNNVTLSEYDMIVVCVGSSWNTQYTSNEVSAIVQYVQSGGGLLVLGDNPRTMNANINPVAQAFGSTLSVDTNQVINPYDLYITNFASHQIFDGISSVYFRLAGPVTAIAPSQIVAWEPGGIGVLAIAEVGLGRVLITGDINLWDHVFIRNRDNIPFAVNVFEWLSTKTHICADANGDSLITFDDLDFLLTYYFAFGPAPDPIAVADLNCSGGVDIADIVMLAQFLNGEEPPICCLEGQGEPPTGLDWKKKPEEIATGPK